jgi:hypothetical protein
MATLKIDDAHRGRRRALDSHTGPGARRRKEGANFESAGEIVGKRKDFGRRQAGILLCGPSAKNRRGVSAAATLIFLS